jgi:hypothetical protein
MSKSYTNRVKSYQKLVTRYEESIDNSIVINCKLTIYDIIKIVQAIQNDFKIN